MDGMINNEKVVLVVDDLFENLLILKKMLEKCGYTPITASSAKDALDMMKMKMPELILLDVYMPEMDGFQLYDKMQENPYSAEIPVIFCTAESSKEVKEKGSRLGADCIRKPYSTENLRESIKKVFEKQ